MVEAVELYETRTKISASAGRSFMVDGCGCAPISVLAYMDWTRRLHIHFRLSPNQTSLRCGFSVEMLFHRRMIL